MSVDTASPQPGDLVLPLTSAEGSMGVSPSPAPLFDQDLFRELWLAADGAACGLTCEEFGSALTSAGEKFNYGLAASNNADATQRAAFLRTLHLSELALAYSCALGRESAWQRFLGLYRSSLTQAAIAITGSATVGHELADSLYGELYGLRELDGQRRSPLSSYSGRGSLLGWLRTTLAQRHVDHHRRTRREAPLDNVDVPSAEVSAPPKSSEVSRLSDAVRRSLQTLKAEDRFILAAYFLDRQSLLEISRVIRVHEATISRRLKRLAGDLRKQLMHNLQSGGLSKRAAEEALGTDPRDIELDLRALLQTSQSMPFSDETQSPPIAASEKP